MTANGPENTTVNRTIVNTCLANFELNISRQHSMDGLYAVQGTTCRVIGDGRATSTPMLQNEPRKTLPLRAESAFGDDK